MTITAEPAHADPLLRPRVHEVLAVIEEIPDVVTLRVAPVDGPPPEFLPAQIGMVGAFGVGEAAISISSAVTERSYHEFTIRRVGAITGALTRLQVGEQLWVRSPFGAPWDLGLDGHDLVIAAGGIGLAPLRSAIYEVLRQRDRYGRVVLVVGGRESSHLLYSREYDTWRQHGMTVVPTIDVPEPGWTGSVGFVHVTMGSVIDALGFDPSQTSALVCGPDAMMRCVADALVERGTPAGRVQLTLERNMQCGNGLCGHCQLGSILVCRDGPVVRYPTVAATLGVEEL